MILISLFFKTVITKRISAPAQNAVRWIMRYRDHLTISPMVPGAALAALLSSVSMCMASA